MWTLGGVGKQTGINTLFSWFKFHLISTFTYNFYQRKRWPTSFFLKGFFFIFNAMIIQKNIFETMSNFCKKFQALNKTPFQISHFWKHRKTLLNFEKNLFFKELWKQCHSFIFKYICFWLQNTNTLKEWSVWNCYKNRFAIDAWGKLAKCFF